MNSIRPVNPNEPKTELTMVAQNQPQYQTLPSIFMKDGNVCVSRWAFEDEEREIIKEHKLLFFYQISNKKADELTGAFLSVDFIEESELKSEMRYSNRVFFLGDHGGYNISFATKMPQEYVWRFKWELSEAQVEKALESNSVYIYQFNLRKPITPMSLSPYFDLTFTI